MNSSERRILYITPSISNTTLVYNFAGDSAINDFLHLFDIWGSYGGFKLCSDENHQYIRFECSKNFMNLKDSEDFKRAFHRMNVKVTTNYEDVKDLF